MSKTNNNETVEKKSVLEKKTTPLTDEALDEIAGGDWLDDHKEIIQRIIHQAGDVHGPL